jgi:membrane protease YdiL (CAAX protease family)
MLDECGIKAHIQGEHISTLQGAVPFGTASAPSIWVDDDADSEQAQSLIKEYLQNPKLHDRAGYWTCPQCAEVSEPQFTACWNCGTEQQSQPKASDATAAAPIEHPVGGEDADTTQKIKPAPPTITRPTTELWIETGVVLIVAVLPALYSAVEPLIWPSDSKRQFVPDQLYLIVWALHVSTFLLYVIWRSQEPWEFFGLTRPHVMKDGIAGVVIWLVQITAWTTVSTIIASVIGYDKLVALMDYSDDMFARPAGAEFLLLPFSCAAVGFAEELVMRGYLIPRFEQLFGSSVKAVVVSSLMFASYHAYQGAGGVMSAFVFGLVWGVAFCWIRRVWPIALAHAINNFVLA